MKVMILYLILTNINYDILINKKELNNDLQNYIVKSRIETESGYISEVEEGIFKDKNNVSYVFKSKLSVNKKSKLWYFEILLCRGEEVLYSFSSDGKELIKGCLYNKDIRYDELFTNNSKEESVIDNHIHIIKRSNYDSGRRMFKRLVKTIQDKENKKIIFRQQIDIVFIEESKHIFNYYQDRLSFVKKRYRYYKNGMVSKVEGGYINNYTNDEKLLHNFNY